MPHIKSFTDKHPVRFGFLITLVFILLVLMSSIVVGRIWPAETSAWYSGSMIGRLVSSLILLFIAARLGWLRSAGFTSPGNLRTWLILLLPLAYSIAISAYSMTGNFDFSFSEPIFIAVLFIMSHAFLEEVVFRGLVLHAFVRARGATNTGLVKCVLVSSLFFGGYHILYIAGEPPSVVFVRIIVTFLMGILLGALVLRSGSIYPAVFFHGLWNVAGYLNLTGNSAQATASSWLQLSLYVVPLALYGWFLLRNLTHTMEPSTHPMRTEYPARWKASKERRESHDM
jgi:membrane protease YdiL (CAAX protease family)